MSINSETPSYNTLASHNAKILVVMARIDREVVILACKRVQPQIEAVDEANEEFIK
jgi:hypothetical protein